MNREEKKALVENIQEIVSSNSCVLVCNYKGLKVSDANALRNGAREFEIGVKVAKNTLVKKSLENTKFSGISDFFKDQVLFVFANDEVSLAKFITKFDKEVEALSIVAGSFFDEVYKPEDVATLSKTPSLDESRAKIIGLLTASASKLVGVLNAPAQNVVGVLKAYSEK